MTAIVMIVLEVQSQGLKARVLFNDVEVFQEATGVRKTSQVKLNPYVLEAGNVVQALLGPALPADAVGANDQAPFFKLRIVAGEHGTEPGEEGRLAAFDWTPTEHPLQGGKMTAVLERPVAISHTFGRWAWESARPSALDPADREAILKRVRSVHDALAKEDLPRVMELLSLKTRELARALGLAEDRMVAGQESFFRTFFEASDWMMEPLDPAQLVLHLQAKGRLVSVTDASGGPALKGRAGERTFLLPVTVAAIEGDWTIVR